jgi:hypothetical protein
MLEEDRSEFFNFLSSRYGLVAARWTSSAADVVVCEMPPRERGPLALWEAGPDSQRQRTKVIREDGSVAYDFDRQDSILEFDPGAVVMHGGLPALLQGRLYSFLKETDAGTTRLYRSARQWIKRSFEPCPLKLLGGYVGPVAMRWYREAGGILLPMFNPPSTPAWEEFITNQHRPEPVH